MRALGEPWTNRGVGTYNSSCQNLDDPGEFATDRNGMHDRIGGCQKDVRQVVVPRQRDVDLPFFGGR